MYDLGIIGGMGSQATVEIFDRIVKNTEASCDQEHIEICILNKAKITDRTDFILNGGVSPLPTLLEGVEDLKKLGIKFFAIPCNTAHYFAKDLVEVGGITFINMIEETKNYIKKLCKYKKVCVLCTSGTAKANIYGNNIDEDISVFYPNSHLQNELMNIIKDVKSGISTIENNRDKLFYIMSEIISVYDECLFIVACTELSVVVEGENFKSLDFIDAMDILTFNIIKKSGYKIKENSNIDISLI
ncbi:MAG: aspartate/glutamate racemase family protein [Lachnospirales bacterium]